MKRRDATKRIGGIDAKLPFGGSRWSADMYTDGIWVNKKFDSPSRDMEKSRIFAYVTFNGTTDVTNMVRIA